MGRDIYFCTPSCHLTLLYVFEFSSLNECISTENEKVAAEKEIWGNGSCYRNVRCYYSC